MAEELIPGALYKIIGSKCAIEARYRIKNMVYFPYAEIVFKEDNLVGSCYWSYRYLTTTGTQGKKYMFIEKLKLDFSYFRSNYGYVFYGVEDKKKILITKNKSYRGGKLLVDCFKKVV